MRQNLPVTQREFDFPDSELIVSTTDAQGRITHCNRAFVAVSGYAYEELRGQPHNLVRHPDMPPEAFKDMWATVGRCRPWTGIVKNRRKNGDHYWVRANVAPIVHQGKPVGYLSVRNKATRAEVAAAEALYRQIDDERRRGRPTVKLHAGRVRRVGWRDLPGRLHRMTLSQRLGTGLGALVLGAIGLPAALVAAGHGAAMPWLPSLAGSTWALAIAASLVAWFRFSVQTQLDKAERFANDLAGCNLTTELDLVHPHPTSQLARALSQIQINLRAIIGNARDEIDGTAATTADIARGSQDLSQRTQAQADALRATASSMQQLAGTVGQTAQTADEVVRQSEATAAAAGAGGNAMQRVGSTIETIQDSSKQVVEIVDVIQRIAFQTNILALNAAVEAARAGEAGRGFAVVAGDVRALAQRSALAAREISALIQKSAERVDESVREMTRASGTIDRTVQEVNRAGEMIRWITQAAAEQSTGIGAVNAAVGELDTMTQANAGLVVETVRAVAALHERTETLKRSVQLFRL